MKRYESMGYKYKCVQRHQSINGLVYVTLFAVYRWMSLHRFRAFSRTGKKKERKTEWKKKNRERYEQKREEENTPIHMLFMILYLFNEFKMKKNLRKDKKTIP